MAKLFTIRVTLNPPNPAEVFGKNADAYMKGAEIVFRTSVFKFLELLIRFGRRKTGRLVSGFTPMMDAHNYNYLRSWQHSDEENAQAVLEGKAAGTFDESNPWDLIIVNAVEYAGYVEEKVGVTEKGQLPILIPYFEKFMVENFDAFMQNAAKGGFETKNFGLIEDFGPPEVS